MNELKTCPFCGGEVGWSETEDESVYSHAIVPYYKVGCDNCEISINWIEDKDEVLERWNTRHTQGGESK